MAVPFDPTDPANMTSQQRVEEIASILAEGVLRLRRRGVVLAHSLPAKILSDSEQNGLDDSGETRLHGQRG